MTTVVKAFTLANELLYSVDAHMSMSERATRVDRVEEFKVESETLADEQKGSRKAMANLTLEHAELRESIEAAKQLDYA